VTTNIYSNSLALIYWELWCTLPLPAAGSPYMKVTKFFTRRN